MTEEGSDSNFKYHGNYAQIADAIQQFVPAWMPQMEQFFRMVVFDYRVSRDRRVTSNLTSTK
jgi:serine/threonine protein kinase HipA of HipAB toxin-antitoxin module